MARDLSFGNFVKELGTRLSAAAVVVGIFYGLGDVNRTDFLGLSRLLDGRFAFFAAAFAVVGLVSAGWIGLQRYGG